MGDLNCLIRDPRDWAMGSPINPSMCSWDGSWDYPSTHWDASWDGPSTHWGVASVHGMKHCPSPVAAWAAATGDGQRREVRKANHLAYLTSRTTGTTVEDTTAGYCWRNTDS